MVQKVIFQTSKMGWSVDRDDPDGFNEIPRVFAFRFDERFRGFHDREAKKAFSFAATSRMAVLVCPGEISVVGQNLTSILQNIFVGKETFWGVHSANLAG